MPLQHVGEDLVHDDKALAEAGLRAARGFAALGIGEGDAVALLLRNDIPLFEVAQAAGHVGAYIVPINWHAQAEEFRYILDDCGAKVLVVHADLLPRVAAAIPANLPIFVVATPKPIQAAFGIDPEAAKVPAGQTAWREWVSRHEPMSPTGRRAAEPIIYTSGTTGRPKGVKRMPTNPTFVERTMGVARRLFDVSPVMRTVMTAPMYHSAPSSFGLHGAAAGAYLLLQPRFDAESLLALIEREKLTHLYMVPTMFVRLLKLPPEIRNRYDLSSLKHVVHAGAPCPPGVKKAMIDWWGPIIGEYFGTTETNAITYCDSQQWLARPGTVGQVLEGAMVRIYGEDGAVLGPDGIGAVYMRSDLCPDFAYHNAPAKRREIERDGFVTAGDIGYLDAENYLFLCGRRSDIVISGGVNIYPAEIEAALIGMPGVRDCAVFGIPDDEMGESLAAVIEPEPGTVPSEADVRTWLRPKLAGYKLPRLIQFRNDLPREDSGKIFKRRLRDPFWEGTGRSI